MSLDEAAGSKHHVRRWPHTRPYTGASTYVAGYNLYGTEPCTNLAILHTQAVVLCTHAHTRSLNECIDPHAWGKCQLLHSQHNSGHSSTSLCQQAHIAAALATPEELLSSAVQTPRDHRIHSCLLYCMLICQAKAAVHSISRTKVNLTAASLRLHHTSSSSRCKPQQMLQ